MKKTVTFLLALIMLSALICACGAPEQGDPAATKAPDQSAPAAMRTPDPTPLSENIPVKIVDLTYETFFDADLVANEIETNGSPIGIAYDGVPGWTVADGKLYYKCRSDGMLRCRDIASGEDTALFNAAEAELYGDITYCNDMIYLHNQHTENNETTKSVSAFKLDGTPAGKIEIPKELYDIEADTSSPDDPYVGYTYLVKYGGEVMLGVYVYNEERNYYTIDFQNNTFVPCEAPYTISRDDNRNTVVTYRDGSSVTLASYDRELVEFIGENGDIYSIYYYEPGNHEYRRYSSEGKLLGVSRYGEEYSPDGEILIRYVEGEAGCLYFMDCSDESIMLIKVSLG